MVFNVVVLHFICSVCDCYPWWKLYICRVWSEPQLHISFAHRILQITEMILALWHRKKCALLNYTSSCSVLPTHCEVRLLRLMLKCIKKMLACLCLYSLSSWQDKHDDGWLRLMSPWWSDISLIKVTCLNTSRLNKHGPLFQQYYRQQTSSGECILHHIKPTLAEMILDIGL